jgi:hypothetical protein
MDQTRKHFRTFASQRAALLCFLTVSSVCPALAAEEPRLASEPYLFSEPAETTQVVDAFDEGDPFDLHLSVGYQYSSQSADILREGSTAGSGGTIEVARYKETTHRLNTRADIGLYHDIALVLRMPIILANDRSLDQLGSGGVGAGTSGITSVDNVPLFQLPFRAPTRSGIEYIAVGFDFGVLNQYRDSSKPTWVFGFEGRFDVSTPMHACNAAPPSGQVNCADPGDVDRNGQYNDPPLTDNRNPPTTLEGSPISNRKAGVSRGTTGLEIHTYLSKRIKYIEPYGGLRMLAELPRAKSDYDLIDFKASLVNHPPLEGSLIMGLAIIPWEVRSEYQRTTLDLRLTSTYRSEGRDYSELFDALGSSPAMSLRAPAWSGYQAGAPVTDPVTGQTTTPSVVNPNSRRVYFNGLTDVQQHVKNRLSAEFTWQAARFVKFGVGLGYTMIQSHYVTNDQACNANFTDDRDKSGPCRKDNPAGSSTQYDVTGIPNPNYRPSINAAGRRYLVTNSSLFDGWINATVMF